MKRNPSTSFGAALTIAVGIATSSVASAAVLTFPAGVACTFELEVTVVGEGPQVEKVFHDRNGNLVRFLLAGKGSELTFKNTDTGSNLRLQPNGSVSLTRFNPDGTQTVTSTGHNVLVMFPTDVPAGPSTTLYVGRLVYKVDSSEVFTFISATGRSTDICATLS